MVVVFLDVTVSIRRMKNSFTYGTVNTYKSGMDDIVLRYSILEY